MNDKLHVAVDLDDVVLDFTGGVRHAVQQEYGVKVPDFAGWDIKEVLDPIIGKSWWKWMKERDWLWPNFPAIEGSIGGIATLRADGCYLELLTSKPEWAEYSVWKWLGKWRPPVHRVTIVGMKEQKLEASEADLIIDDKPETVKQWAADGRGAILFDRPHNATVPLDPGMYRAFNWQEVVQLVRREDKEGLA